MALSHGCWRDTISGHPHLQIDLIERVLQGIRVVFLIILVVILLWRDTKPGRVRAHRPRGAGSTHTAEVKGCTSPRDVPWAPRSWCRRARGWPRRSPYLLVARISDKSWPARPSSSSSSSSSWSSHMSLESSARGREAAAARARVSLPHPDRPGHRSPAGPSGRGPGQIPPPGPTGGREQAERLCGTIGAGSAGLLATPEVLQADPGDQPGPSGTLPGSQRSASPGPGCQPSLQGGRAPWLHSAGAAWRAALASVTLDSSLMISFRILTSRGTLVQRSGSGRRRRLHVPLSLGRCPARQCATPPPALHCPARTQP